MAWGGWVVSETRILLGGKVWAHGLGPVGGLEVAHLWSSTGGGLHYVKFSIALPADFSHHQLRRGISAEVFHGPQSLGKSVMADVDRAGWTFVADGLFRRAEHFNAEDGTGATSTNLQTIITQANLRGMGWTGFGNLPNVAVSVAAEGNNSLRKVADVINAYCTDTGQRWGVGVDGVPYVATDGTDVAWTLRPGTPALPTADDDYVSRVTVRYVSAVAGTPSEPSEWEVVSASTTDTPHGPRETQEDITDQGLLATIDAQTYADNYLAANGARTAFTAAVAVNTELTTPASTSMDPWSAGLLTLGKLGRHHGVLGSEGGQQRYGETLQWVCGSTVYKPGEALVMTPVDIAARTVAQVIFSKSTLDLRKRAGLVDD